MDHADVGAMLVEKWRFPDNLVETIRYQYGPEVMDTGTIACVFAANQISKQLRIGYAVNACVEEFSAVLARRLGGTLDQVRASLRDIHPMVKDLHFVASLGNVQV